MKTQPTTDPVKAAKIARRLALNWVNEQRKADGLPPINRLTKLWWSINGPEFVAKVVGETLDAWSAGKLNNP